MSNRRDEVFETWWDQCEDDHDWYNMSKTDVARLVWRRAWSEVDRAEAELAKVKAAARAVITQWDSPNWKLTTPTGTLIYALRDAIGDTNEPPRLQTNFDPRDQRIIELEDEVQRLKDRATELAVNILHVTKALGIDLGTLPEGESVWPKLIEEAEKRTAEVKRLQQNSAENEALAAGVYVTPHGESFSEGECIAWLAAEVRWLTKEVANLRHYAGAEIYMSDFQTAGHMRAELQRLRTVNAELLGALRDLVEDIEGRFDMTSESTNPGIRHCVSVARTAIASAEQGGKGEAQ